MVFHVGIDIGIFIDVAAFDEMNNKTIKFKPDAFFYINFGINQIDDLFNNVKSKLRGDLGYVCFFIHDFFQNDFRQECVKKGKEYGFKKVLIINPITKMCLESLISLKENSKVGDIIWIFTWNKCVICEITNTKTKIINILDDTFSVITENDLLQIKEDSAINKNPDLIIFDVVDLKDFSEILKNTFPDCKCVLNNSIFETSEIALIKARISAKDPNIDANIRMCDIDNYFYQKAWVRTPSLPEDILNMEVLPLLPLEKLITIPVESDEKIMEIYCNIGYHKEWVKIEITAEMVEIGEILFVMTIDENNIFSYDYSIIKTKTVENIESRIKKIYENELKLEAKKFNIPQKGLINNPNVNAAGIDLGMTQCSVAVNRKDKFELVAIDNADKQLPSYISFKEKNPICGQLVINQLQFYATSTVFDIKRILGKKLDEIEINSAWPFEIIKSEKGEPLIRVQNSNGNILETHPEEVSTILLKHLKQKAEEFQGRMMNEVVITIPAGFNTSQKVSTHISAELAGFKTVHLLSEPIAASIAYFVDRPIPSNFTMLLFDLGGGTLDLCIFKVKNDKLKIITYYGDGNFGGRDFDNVLFKYFARILETVYQITINQRHKFRLMQKCVEIKHALSTENEASLEIAAFNPDIDEFLTITRQEFEILAVPLLNHIQEILKQTFSRTEIFASDINKILLVGGGCRMPMIQLFLRHAFTLADHTCAKNPDEMVAIGAAYYSSFLLSKSGTGCNIM